ncbi:MAG: hypothetical protein AB1297_04345 [bacterium]
MKTKLFKLILVGFLLILPFTGSPYQEKEDFVITKTEMGFTYKLDLSKVTIKLDIIGPSFEESKICNRLYPDYITAISEAKRLGIPILPSVQLILGKTKQFNDGLYASLETKLQTGVGIINQGKINFLRKLLEKLLAYQKSSSGYKKEISNLAISYIICGLVVSGEKINIPAELEDQINMMRKEFFKDESKSKVVGFFTWSPALRKIFLQDRFYQRTFDLRNEKEAPVAVLISHTIISDPELSEQYRAILEFYEKMTNPFSIFSCEDYGRIIRKYGEIENILLSEQKTKKFISFFLKETKGSKEMALFPYSYSKETELMKKIDDYVSMTSLIKLIQKGKINLTPTKDSGWYDYQQYALETLILPEKAEEAKKLILTQEYKEYLEKAFGAMFIKARETHVKQLEIAEEIEISIFPELRVEPLATVYLRAALGYKFLSENLSTILGSSALKDIYRMRERESDESISMAKELHQIMLLMYGLYLLSCQDIGLNPQVKEFNEEEIKQARDIALTWIKNLENDKDLQKDTRVAVPVFRDYILSRLSYVANWATIGVKLLKIKVEYENKPKVISVKAPFPIDFVYKPQYYLIPIDVYIEFTRTKKPYVFNRKEFRELCEQHKTEEKISSVLRKNLIPYKKLTISVTFIGILFLIAISVWLFRRLFYKKVIR